MRVGFDSDHVAVELKNILMEHLREKGYGCIDFGPSNPADKVDCPEPNHLVAEALIRGEIHEGVLTCGTGIGISLAANKVPGIRVVVCSEPYSAKLTVEHSNANIIATGTRVVGIELAKITMGEFFATRFEGGRHAIRMDVISEIEIKYETKWHE